MIYIVILLLGTFVSMAVVTGTLVRASLVEILGVGTAVLCSLIVLVGYALMMLDLPFSSGNLLIGLGLATGIMIGTFLLAGRKPQVPKIDAIGLAVFVAIWTLVFLLGLFPSLPSGLPLGIQVDGAGHYALADSFVRALSQGSSIHTQYPSGLHMNLAVITLASNLPLAIIIYPFAALITALTCSVTYASLSKLCSHRVSAILASLLIATATPTLIQMAVQDSWAQLFGFFLLCVFFWLAVLYVKDRSSMTIIPLAIVGAALIASYTTFSVIPIALLLMIKPLLRRAQRRSTNFFAAFSFAFFILFAIPRFDYGSVSASMQGAAYSSQVLYVDWFGIAPIVLAAIGVYASRSKPTWKIPRTFMLVSIGQTLVFYIAFQLHIVTLYYLFKHAYLLIYPLSMLAGLGADWLLDHIGIPSFGRHPHHTRRRLLAVLFLCSIVIAATQGLINVDKMRNSQFGINPDQYAVAIWSLRNLPPGDLTFIGNPPNAFWFSVISGHDLKNGAYGWWVKPAINFTSWNQTARAGEVVIILDSSLVPNTSGFRILFRSGNALIAQKMCDNSTCIWNFGSAMTNPSEEVTGS